MKMLKKTAFIVPCLLIAALGWLKYDNLDVALKNYPRLSDTTRIKSDLISITSTARSRNYINLDALNKVATYIKTELQKEAPQ